MYCDDEKMHKLRNEIIKVQKYAYDTKNPALIDMLDPIFECLCDSHCAEDPSISKQN